MVIDSNLVVVKVTESKGFRRIYLRITNLPAGFEAKDVVVTVPASQQDLTLKEANMEIPD
jgi:hypothetical protein